VELDVTPDPPPEERDAVAAALRALAFDAEVARGQSAWWRAGVRENAAADDAEPGRTASELPP
jgi:hypothetical protein